MTKKNKVLIIVFSLICMFLIASVVLLCFLNLKGEKPNKVVVTQTNETILFESSSSSTGNGYTFKFKSKSHELKFVSDLGILDSSLLNDQLEFGEKYNVSVCINGEIEGGNSVYSDPVEWVASRFLDAPTISLNAGKIVWNEVEDADYYEVYSNLSDQAYKSNTNQFQLSKLVGGECDIFVRAVSSEEYFFSSKISNVLKNVQVTHQISEIHQVQFNKSSRLITVYLDEKISEFEVFVGETKDESSKYLFTKLQPTKIGEVYKVTIDLSDIYSGQAFVGVKPASSEYNEYSGEIFWINS